MNEIIRLLRKEPLTITEIVDKSGLTRSKVRIELAMMEGSRMVRFRNVGMAKLYYLEIKK